MRIDEIIKAWKFDELDKQNGHIPENPAGYELSDGELAGVVGGVGSRRSRSRSRRRRSRSRRRRSWST